MLAALHSIFQTLPALGLFLSVGLGYFAGKFKVGTFQLGGIAGSLLVAVIISQIGVPIDASIGSVLFALFIYTVGFQSGPQLFASLGRKTLKELSLAIFLAVSSLVTALALAKYFTLDKGLAAGIAAGALTQSAMIGTAGAALAKLGLSPEALQVQQSQVAIGYAVTYIFGSLGAIIMCTTILPLITRRSIRSDAQAALVNSTHSPLVGTIGQSALPEIVGRVYVAKDNTKVSDLEREEARVETIVRNGHSVLTAQTTELKQGDKVLLLGPRYSVEKAALLLGPEDVHAEKADGKMNIPLKTAKFIPNAKEHKGKSWETIVKALSGEDIASVWLLDVQRNGVALSPKDANTIQANDIAVLYGSTGDIKRIGEALGKAAPGNEATNFVYHGIGITLGLLLGMIVLHPFGIPLTLGSGGGAMLSGLVFGWFQGKHPATGGISKGAASFLVQYGLAGFVAVVGLRSGGQALSTIEHQGMLIFVLGCIITTVPLFLTLLFGWFVLKYRNIALFAGALSGARSANPAFGQVLEAAGNNVPGVPFAITYAVANVLLTLLGPLIVALA